MESLVWCYVPVIPALRRLRLKIVSSRQTGLSYENLSQKKKEK
jgi:hypothetical protein